MRGSGGRADRQREAGVIAEMTRPHPKSAPSGMKVWKERLLAMSSVQGCLVLGPTPGQGGGMGGATSAEKVLDSTAGKHENGESLPWV